MPLEIKKQGKESSQNLIRRFSRRVKMSGILLQARKIRFYKRTKSRHMKKSSALRKEEMKEQYELEKKLNKPIEKQTRNRLY